MAINNPRISDWLWYLIPCYGGLVFLCTLTTTTLTTFKAGIFYIGYSYQILHLLYTATLLFIYTQLVFQTFRGKYRFACLFFFTLMCSLSILVDIYLFIHYVVKNKKSNASIWKHFVSAFTNWDLKIHRL